MRRKLLVLAIGLTGCATAHRDSLGGRPDGGITIGGDSNNNNGDSGVLIDAAPHIDGPMQSGSQTLTQTGDNTVAANNSVACGGSGGTSQNSYYRVFPLPDSGINGAFAVTNVTFQVEYASSAPAATVKVGTFTGTTGGATINSAGISVIQTATAPIPDADVDDQPPVPGTVDVPISATIPALSNLVVEVDVPSSAGFFYIGTTVGSESKPGYVSTTSTASGCNPPAATPTSMASLVGTPSGILLTVTGVPQ